MRIPVILPLLALAGCAMPAGDFPGLAKRSIESRGDAIAPAPPPLPADPAVAMRATALDRDVAAAAIAFDRVRGAAEAGAARAGAAGSESWIAAQLALNTLVAHRARVVDTLGELEALLVAEYSAGRMVAPATAALADRARGVAEAQAATIDAIAARLRG